ncbi:MAG: glycosyltransferase family 39 protein [Bacteroidota bacterium]
MQFLSQNRLLLGLAFVKLLIHLVVNAMGGYGYFRDEFYYLACSDHLDWGYVDHPPLSIFLLWVNRFVFGDSLVALRLLPAIAGAALVVFAGLIARAFGGGTRAQLVAGIATIIAPVYLSIHGFYSMNGFEPLFWMVAVYLLIRIIKEENGQLWLWFGVVAGLGLQNKISMSFFGAALVGGLLLTRERKNLRGKYLWMGGGIAGLLFLPHILWQFVNDWPTLEFMNNARLYKNVSFSAADFLSAQILYEHPVTAPLWIGGVLLLLLHKELNRYRAFAIAFLLLFALFVLQGGKPYYLSPIYPLFFAAGAVGLERLVDRFRQGWVIWAYSVLIVIGGAVTAPLVLPVLPVETFLRYNTSLGIGEVQAERHQKTVLPQHYADMHGWKEMTESVARVYQALPDSDKVRCGIYAQNYGEAGAIDFFGEEYELPKASSGHNNYWLWGLQGPGEVMIIVGGRAEDHARAFTSVELVGRHSHEYAMRFESDLPIFLCRNLKAPPAELWPGTKRFI